MRVKRIKEDRIGQRYVIPLADLEFWRKVATDKQFFDKPCGDPPKKKTRQ